MPEERATKFKYYFLQDMNPVIRFLIISDTVIRSGAGLLGPIFALFVTDFIQGGNAEVAGLAAAIYLLTKSLFQVPIAYLIDKVRGEKDDFWLMFVFTLLISFMPLWYLAVRTPLELYLVQFALGVCAAFVFPTYMAIFTRHIDRDKEGTEWGVYFTLTDLTGAAFAALGGYIAVTEGFPTLILAVVAMSVCGSLLLWPIRPYIRM